MEERAAAMSLERWARLISVILHPVFMPVYALLIIFQAPTFMVHLPGDLKRIIFLLAAVNMTIVPVSVMPLLRYRNIISSYHMEVRHERIVPLSIGSMMYVVTTIIFFSYQIPVLIKSFMLAASVTSFLVLVITFRWKISVHAAGMGALLATVLVLSIRMMAGLIAIWLPLLIVSGLLLSARLYLRSHTPAQVYSGFLLGLVSVFIVMMIF